MMDEMGLLTCLGSTFSDMDAAIEGRCGHVKGQRGWCNIQACTGHLMVCDQATHCIHRCP